MPWRNPRGFTFSPESISKSAPAASGVYAIFREGLWIYIGETDNIRGRLRAHLTGNDRCMARYLPSAFSFELCPAQERVERCAELIADLNPPCNHIFR